MNDRDKVERLLRLRLLAEDARSVPRRRRRLPPSTYKSALTTTRSSFEAEAHRRLHAHAPHLPAPPPPSPPASHVVIDTPSSSMQPDTPSPPTCRPGPNAGGCDRPPVSSWTRSNPHLRAWTAGTVGAGRPGPRHASRAEQQRADKQQRFDPTEKATYSVTEPVEKVGYEPLHPY